MCTTPRLAVKYKGEVDLSRNSGNLREHSDVAILLSQKQILYSLDAEEKYGEISYCERAESSMSSISLESYVWCVSKFEEPFSLDSLSEGSSNTVDNVSFPSLVLQSEEILFPGYGYQDGKPPSRFDTVGLFLSGSGESGGGVW
jgi:hypothetical protein